MSTKVDDWPIREIGTWTSGGHADDQETYDFSYSSTLCSSIVGFSSSGKSCFSFKKSSIDEVESSPAKVVADSVIEDDDEIEEDDEDVDSEEFEAEFDSLDDIDDEIEEGEDF